MNKNFHYECVVCSSNFEEKAPISGELPPICVDCWSKDCKSTDFNK